MGGSPQRYSVNCMTAPRSDMAAMPDIGGKPNPACNLETYHGGIQCCKHTWFLTDRDQDSMIPAAVDTYYLKWRYYFQEYTPATPTTPASHQHLHHWVFLIDAQVNDYEEDNDCGGGMCMGRITAHLTARGMGLEDVPGAFSGITPLVMTPHCHAPSCIREELYNEDTGELICNATARYGTGTEIFNEKNYLALPPCLWGHQPGLRKPLVLLPGTKVKAIKYFNNTFRHLGQMAQWTGMMVYQP